MIEFGKKITPKTSAPEKTARRISGPTWSVEQRGHEYIFEYLSGSHGGGIKTAKVTAEDFDALRAGRLTDYDLMLKYDLS